MWREVQAHTPVGAHAVRFPGKRAHCVARPLVGSASAVPGPLVPFCFSHESAGSLCVTTPASPPPRVTPTRCCLRRLATCASIWQERLSGRNPGGQPRGRRGGQAPRPGWQRGVRGGTRGSWTESFSGGGRPRPRAFDYAFAAAPGASGPGRFGGGSWTRSGACSTRGPIAGAGKPRGRPSPSGC